MDKFAKTEENKLQIITSQYNFRKIPTTPIIKKIPGIIQKQVISDMTINVSTYLSTIKRRTIYQKYFDPCGPVPSVHAIYEGTNDYVWGPEFGITTIKSLRAKYILKMHAFRYYITFPHHLYYQRYISTNFSVKLSETVDDLKAYTDAKTPILLSAKAIKYQLAIRPRCSVKLEDPGPSSRNSFP